MIDWSSCQTVERDPERVSGAWVFRGTRIPVAALFENLKDGASTTQFVEWFPGATLEQVRIVLDHAARSALAPAWMRILFDQGTPEPLRTSLILHEVSIAYEKGWAKLGNGGLLSAAERDGYELPVSTVTHLRFQHNLSGQRIGIVVLLTTSWPRIRRVIPSVVSAVDSPHREAIRNSGVRCVTPYEITL